MKKTEGPRSWQTEEELFKELCEELLSKPKLSIAEHVRRREALLAQDRWAERQAELSLIAKQRAIDSVWEATLAAKRREAEDAEDPDERLRQMIWGGVERLERREAARRRQEALAAQAAAKAMVDAKQGRRR